MDTFVYSRDASGDFGDDIILDFNGAEDKLSFTDVLDSALPGGLEINDVDAAMTGHVNEGAGGDLTISFDAGSITFVGAGFDGVFNSIADLVNDANTQVLVS
jgi:hypothetical protein